MLRGGVRRRQTLVACLGRGQVQRANNNNEWRKEASFVRGLSARRKVENERTGEEEGSRLDVEVEKRRGR
jgi:hypothetical protein